MGDVGSCNAPCCLLCTDTVVQPPSPRDAVVARVVVPNLSVHRTAEEDEAIDSLLAAADIAQPDEFEAPAEHTPLAAPVAPAATSTGTAESGSTQQQQHQQASSFDVAQFDVAQQEPATSSTSATGAPDKQGSGLEAHFDASAPVTAWLRELQAGAAGGGDDAVVPGHQVHASHTQQQQGLADQAAADASHGVSLDELMDQEFDRLDEHMQAKAAGGSSGYGTSNGSSNGHSSSAINGAWQPVQPVERKQREEQPSVDTGSSSRSSESVDFWDPVPAVGGSLHHEDNMEAEGAAASTSGSGSSDGGSSGSSHSHSSNGMHASWQAGHSVNTSIQQDEGQSASDTSNGGGKAGGGNGGSASSGGASSSNGSAIGASPHITHFNGHGVGTLLQRNAHAPPS